MDAAWDGFGKGDYIETYALDKVKTSYILIQAARKIPRLAQQDQDSWLEDLRLDSTDAQIALLLCLAKNVGKLNFKVPREHKPHVLDVFLEGALQPDAVEYQFPKLAVVKAGCFYGEKWFSARFFAPLFRLPSMLRIEGYEAILDDERSSHPWPIATSNIKTILIQKSKITEAMIAGIFAACKEVKKCSLRWRQCHSATGQTSFTVSGIWSKLRSQKHSLRKLDLYCNDRRWVRVEESIKTLKDFDQLNSLRLSNLFLTGCGRHNELDKTLELVDILPISLCRLQLYSIGFVILNALRTLAERCARDLPKLHVVAIRNIDCASETELDELCTSFARAGVNFLFEFKVGFKAKSKQCHGQVIQEPSV